MVCTKLQSKIPNSVRKWSFCSFRYTLSTPTSVFYMFRNGVSTIIVFLYQILLNISKYFSGVKKWGRWIFDAQDLSGSLSPWRLLRLFKKKRLVIGWASFEAPPPQHLRSPPAPDEQKVQAIIILYIFWFCMHFVFTVQQTTSLLLVCNSEPESNTQTGPPKNRHLLRILFGQALIGNGQSGFPVGAYCFALWNKLQSKIINLTEIGFGITVQAFQWLSAHDVFLHQS